MRMIKFSCFACLLGSLLNTSARADLKTLAIADAQPSAAMAAKFSQNQGNDALAFALEEALQAIDHRVSDRLQNASLCTVITPDALAAMAHRPARPLAPPGKPQPLRAPNSYDLSDSKTASVLKDGKVHYVATLLVENFNIQVLDLGASTAASITANGEYNSAYGNQGNNYYNNNGVNRRETKAQAVARANDKSIMKSQVLRMTVRYQIYDTSTKEIVATDNLEFSTNRVYNALANGRNEMATDDLCNKAAYHVADWVLPKVGEVVNPITIIDMDTDSVTINRGANSGIQMSQVFGVYKLGKEMVDPNTHESLGRREEFVGKVSITDMQTKFSRARITSNNGVMIGAILHLDQKVK